MKKSQPIKMFKLIVPDNLNLSQIFKDNTNLNDDVIDTIAQFYGKYYPH